VHRARIGLLPLTPGFESATGRSGSIRAYRAHVNADIRRPIEQERDQVARAIAISLNSPIERALARASRLPLEDMRCAHDGDQIVATAGEYRFDQWFGGRPLATSGIWGVSTLPESRSAGLASACVRALMDDARARGDALTSLFPAVLGPYRKLGYEIAGTFVEHRLVLDAIPPAPRDQLLKVELLDPERDLRGVKACYQEWIRHANGPVEPKEDAWWMKSVFDGYDQTLRCVVVRGDDGGIEGFASIVRKETEGPLDVAFGLECEPLIATTARALQTLLDYFRSHRGVGRWVSWNGPINDPVAILVDEQLIQSPFTHRWMLRLLNVADALACRGYPVISADITLAIDDPIYAENTGTWRLHVHGGKADVERVETPPDMQPISIGAVSAMFTGYLRPRDAVRLGAVASDAAIVEDLDRLFAGPDPWCPFFF
jgi:predicted acetyltransferase